MKCAKTGQKGTEFVYGLTLLDNKRFGVVNNTTKSLTGTGEERSSKERDLARKGVKKWQVEVETN